jgi:transposase
MKKYTLTDFNKQFPDDDACLEWLMKAFNPDGIIWCPLCERVTNHHKMKSRRSYSCDRCGHHYHPTAGTIFHKSSTSLHDWFYAIFLVSHTRSGISAKQLQRELGVTYKTAWRMFNRIRELMNTPMQEMAGQIEIDETYIGGVKRGAKGGRSTTENKTPILGIAQRDGIIAAIKVPNVRVKTILPIIRKYVVGYSLVYTDDFPTYTALDGTTYFHRIVHHNAKQWVKYSAHTNTIEGFWSILKRSLNGVYHSVRPKYLQNYVDEYLFRYNHRLDKKPMFLTILSKV